jgi:hypothetical protein
MTESDRKPGLLFGPDGKIRLLWRAVIFFVLADWLLRQSEKETDGD